MGILAFIFFGIGAIISLIYGVILIIKAFQVSVWWGLGYLFVPFVALIFIIVHWETAKEPFLKSLLALPFLILGFILAPNSLSNYTAGQDDETEATPSSYQQ